MDNDPLAQFRRLGQRGPVRPAAGSVDAIKLREYKAFKADEASTPALLLIKKMIIKNGPAADRALSYGYLTDVISDGYGFVFSLTFCLPFPGPLVVGFTGEGMGPVLDAILKRSVVEVQVFDPDRFSAPPEGNFDVAADAWRGVPIIREITFNEATPEKSQQH